jgi:hypothetical protein
LITPVSVFGGKYSNDQKGLCSSRAAAILSVIFIEGRKILLNLIFGDVAPPLQYYYISKKGGKMEKKEQFN